MYVGVTRARQTLVLSHCRKRRAAGRSSRIPEPSRFLTELRAELPKVDGRAAALARIAAMKVRKQGETDGVAAM